MVNLQPLRCHTLDAVLVERETRVILGAYVERALVQLPAALRSTLRLDAHALLGLLQWSQSLSSCPPAYKMQNVNLVDSTAKLFGQGCSGPALLRRGSAASSKPFLSRRVEAARLILMVIVPWAWARAMHAIPSAHSPRRMQWWKAMRKMEALVNALALLCKVTFLADGRFPTLEMLLLRVRFAYSLPLLQRSPEFEFMNQELAWRAFANLLVNARPLWPASIFRSVQTCMGDLLKLAIEPVSQALDVASQADNAAGQCDRAQRAERAKTCHKEADACLLCDSSPPHTPFESECGHVFCYFCLSSECLHSASARCPRCSARLSVHRPHTSDSPRNTCAHAPMAKSIQTS